MPLMTHAQIPVLLTSSVVAHDPGVALKDTGERTRLALDSVAQWLRIDPSLRLVLCDGSNFDFSSIVANQFPSSQIECLHFENNQELVRKCGRGYGEGEIVRFALENSRLINQAGCFAKCSSKLWVENYHQCLQSWNGDLALKGVFLDAFSIFKKTRFSYIDTRFYIASCQAYKKYFLDAHLNLGPKQGHSLEDCFYDICVGQGITRSLLNVYPVIWGVGGGIGVHYKNRPTRLIKEALRLRLIRQSRSFAHLFA